MVRRVLLWAPTVALLTAVGCGGSGSLGAPAQQPAGPAQQSPGAPAAGAPLRNALLTSVPALAGLQPGAEFDFHVRASFSEPLYQGSGRVLFDPAVMRPVAVVRGEALPADFIFVAKLDAAPVESDGLSGLPETAGVVPYAFTGLPGGSGKTVAPGELFHIRFQLLGRPGAHSAVRLLNRADYLQFRAPDGNRLPFDLQTEVGTR